MERDFDVLPDEGFDETDVVTPEEVLHVELEGEEDMPDLHDDEDLTDDSTLDEVEARTGVRRVEATHGTQWLRDDEIRGRLWRERQRLLDVRAALATEQPGTDLELSHLDQHPADAASDLLERERWSALARQIEDELAEVDRAHDRLVTGTYGLCEVCDLPVGASRLAALPATRFCVHHEHMVETMAERISRHSFSGTRAPSPRPPGPVAAVDRAPDASRAGPTKPVVLDAASIEALPLVPLGKIRGVHHRVVWTDGTSMAGVMAVDAGRHLGRHTHRHHNHHIWILEGSARVLGDDLGPGSYVHIPYGVEHDIDATGSRGCTFLYLYLDQTSTADREEP